MLYLQLCFSFVALLSWAWLIPLYLLLVKSISLDNCIINNLNNATSLKLCHNDDYQYPERSISFCLGSQLGFAILVSFITLTTYCNKCCFEELCTYEIKFYDKYIGRQSVSVSA